MILSYFPLPGGTYWKSSPFGWRTHPVTGVRTLHRGADYACPSGTPIYAAMAGTVTTGYEAGGAGNWTNITSGRNVIKMFHQSRYEVRGGYVNAGQVIGYIGTTGSSTGPHLHFELWINGSVVDPGPELDAAPIVGTTPTPVPPPGHPTDPEDEDIVKILAHSTEGIFSVSGLFKRHLSGPEFAALKFYGMNAEPGTHDQLLSTYTEIPRDKLAGND